MIDQKSNSPGEKESKSLEISNSEKANAPKKGPLSFLSGAITSGFLAWASFVLSKNVISYFSIHSPNYTSPIAQSAASGFKTLTIGMCFLATFTFAFIGLGLTLVFILSLFNGKAVDGA